MPFTRSETDSRPRSASSAASRPDSLVAAVVGALAALAALTALVLASPSPAGATGSDAEILTAVESDGRYLEVAADTELEASIDRLNSRGVAFVWLDRDLAEDESFGLAERLVEELQVVGAPFETVLVLSDTDFGASSFTFEQSAMDPALDAAFEGFVDGDVPSGLDAFGQSLTAGATTATTAAGSDSGTGAAGGTGTGSDGSGGFGIGSLLLPLAILGGGFWMFRRWRAGRRAREEEAIELEEDRAEIKEQLKNNADHVIELGDRVIAAANPELIQIYEKASESYQVVSGAVDKADTAESIDALDDRIDEAEWQFELIEARLGGRPDPPPPAPDEGDAPSPRPAPGAGPDDGRPIPGPGPGRDGPVVISPRTGRRYPTTRRRRGGGMLGGGGGLGGVLGGVLGNIILGGGLGGGRSRRSRRRSGFDFGFPAGGQTPRRRSGGGLGGGLGGGVLRRGGGRSSRPSPRRTTRQRRTGGGRSLGRRSGGSRRL